MNILGIWDGHDAGAALLQDGELRFAVNEERLTRRKLEVSFPVRSIEACLEHARLGRGDIAVVAASTSDPAKTLGRVWPGSKERYYAVRRRKTLPGPLAGATRALKYRITEWRPGAISRAVSRLTLQRTLSAAGFTRSRLQICDHHEAHAAAAAFAFGVPCAVITIDGLGDGASATISEFRDGRLKRVATSPARSSLGVFFEHVTNLLNMRELEDEGKVMALADYAAPVADADNPLLPLVRVRDGVIQTEWPGHALRAPLARIHWQRANEQFAYMAQRAVELTMVALARDAMQLTGLRRIALAGGVVSNVKATRRIRLLDGVDDLFVFPHMGDGGLPVGAAAVAAAAAGEEVRLGMQTLAIGPAYDTEALAAALAGAGLSAVRLDGRLPDDVADRLAADQVVMWFQGGMEYGPRALGHRSVLARPDRPELRDRLNLVLKRRVWYQPFCPSLLESDACRVLADWHGGSNRHMTMAFEVAPAFRQLMAGVTSIDGTCRPQVVADTESGPFASLLRGARARWQIAAVLNTSFNIHGEPLVCSPADAIDVFLRSGADALAIGPFLIERRS